MAEGILEPQESLKLNFNQTCVQSPLLHRLWACAVLCCLTGQCLAQIFHASGIPAPALVLCPEKHLRAVSKLPHAVSCPSALQPLLVSWSPFKEAAAAVGGVGGALGAPSRLWLREELEFEKTVCSISSVALTLCGFFCCFLSLWVTAVKLMLLWESLSQKSLLTMFSTGLLGTLRG